MKGKPFPPEPYGSANDLPSFVELSEQLRAGKLFTRFIGRAHRPTVLGIEKELKKLAKLIDDFYDVLGPRHWIFPDNLSTTDIEALVQLDADEAEKQLMALYTPDQLRFMVKRLHRHEGLRIRMELINLALQDFEAERYYSTILVLLTVMDGFVNDVDPAQRRGLHARESAEMVAWDSPTGHHMGLSAVHPTFTKGTSKATGDELLELQRNGIMHGTQLNYNNVTVATKAWNRLFAVADWATSRERQAIVSPPQPTLRETVATLSKNEAARRALEAWSARIVTSGDAAFEHDEVHAVTASYLHAWQETNFGAMADYLSSLVEYESHAKTAGQVRAQFQNEVLEEFAILKLDHKAPAVCEVDVTLVVNGQSAPGRLRWIREDVNGTAVSPNEPGSWKVVTWGPWAIRQDAT
jgi:hypothetical protein